MNQFWNLVSQKMGTIKGITNRQARRLENILFSTPEGAKYLEKKGYIPKREVKYACDCSMEEVQEVLDANRVAEEEHKAEEKQFTKEEEIESVKKMLKKDRR